MPDAQTPALAPKIWPVGALCRAIADALEARFNPVAVRGEISGFSRAASGHCYFSLKDENGQLRCAMFRRAAGLLAIGFFTIFFAGMGCLLAGLSLIFAFWDSQRILVSVLVTAFFFLMASLGAWKLSSQLRRKPPMLADTLGELKKDSDGLRGGMRNGS